jgi:hypothetical protein
MQRLCVSRQRRGIESIDGSSPYLSSSCPRLHGSQPKLSSGAVSKYLFNKSQRRRSIRASMLRRFGMFAHPPKQPPFTGIFFGKPAGTSKKIRGFRARFFGSPRGDGQGLQEQQHGALHGWATAARWSG